MIARLLGWLNRMLDDMSYQPMVDSWLLPPDSSP